MNRTLLFICFTLLVSTSYGQHESELKKSRSKLEEFTSKSGTLIKKEFTDIGSFKGCQIKVLKVTDLISTESFSGVKLEGTGLSGSASALLDGDELSGLIKALTIIQERIISTVPEVYTEIVYRSRDGFQAGCYRSKNDWNLFLKLEQFDEKSYIWCKSDDLQKLLSVLTDAKSKI